MVEENRVEKAARRAGEEYRRGFYARFTEPAEVEKKERPMENKFKSRKLWVAVGTILVNILVTQGLVPPDIQKEVITLITVIAGVYIGGQSVDDAVKEAHKEKVIQAEAQAKTAFKERSRM